MAYNIRQCFLNLKSVNFTIKIKIPQVVHMNMQKSMLAVVEKLYCISWDVNADKK